MPDRASFGAAEQELLRARVAITLFFALDGFLFASWTSRIPAIKERVGASTGTLGLALLGLSAGAVLAMTMAGLLYQRWDGRLLTIGFAAVFSVTVALPPLSSSAPALGLVLLAFGAAYGGLDVGMNSAAVDLVARLGRPAMPGFHAAYSLGGLLGAALGGLLAPHLPAETELALLTPVGLAMTLTAGVLLRSPPSARPVSSPRPRLRAPRFVIGYGLIALCTAYGEGAFADWTALHFTQDLHAGAGLAAAAYAPFALAMTAGRLRGTALLERFGQSRVLACGGVAAAAGALVGALTPLPWLALAAFSIAGLGLANTFPVAIARAGELAGPPGVALGSAFGYAGMLAGPPSIGFLAQAFGLPWALTSIALLAAVSSVLACVVRSR